MKKFLFALLLILIMIPLIALPLLSTGTVSVVGRIRIPSVDVSADVFHHVAESCTCGEELWHGGQASTMSDLSDVCIDDRAYLTLLSGQRFVVECVEIIPCIRLGRWLISWNGIVKDNGDVLIFSNGTVYRWTIL